jgi:hypothetical protein
VAPIGRLLPCRREGRSHVTLCPRTGHRGCGQWLR